MAPADDVPRSLGDGFALMRNSYKPYACGLVLHPVIDGCIALREAGCWRVPHTWRALILR